MNVKDIKTNIEPRIVNPKNFTVHSVISLLFILHVQFLKFNLVVYLLTNNGSTYVLVNVIVESDEKNSQLLQGKYLKPMHYKTV